MKSHEMHSNVNGIGSQCERKVVSQELEMWAHSVDFRVIASNYGIQFI